MYTRKNAQVDAILIKTGLNNDLLPTLLHPIQAQQHCPILLTSVNNVDSKTLFSPVEQRARRFLPCSSLVYLVVNKQKIEIKFNFLALIAVNFFRI
jgi:hypothetical protein